MGLAKNSMVFLLTMMGVCGMSMATVYKVGDSAGWTNIGHVDYKSWAATKTFKVGDTILFEYNNKFHNVVRVTHKNFNRCNGTAPYATYATGNDSFTVKRGGHFYFICGFPGHCRDGQRVDIRVPRSASVSAPPPAHDHQLPPATPHTPFDMPWPSPLPSPAANAPAAPNTASSRHLSHINLWLSIMLPVATFWVYALRY